jgi:hypothetical protein
LRRHRVGNAVAVEGGVAMVEMSFDVLSSTLTESETPPIDAGPTNYTPEINFTPEMNYTPEISYTPDVSYTPDISYTPGGTP